MIGCEDRLRNYLWYVDWNAKPCYTVLYGADVSKGIKPVNWLKMLF